jgi:hypothetical protein
MSLSYSLPGLLYVVFLVGIIVHVIKTGRSFLWIWLIVFLPVAGAIAYLVVEILPGIFQSRTARRTARGLKNALDPGADLRRLEEEARMTSNVASRQRYADELVRHGRFEEAISQYRSALTGLYEHDPKLLLGIARAQFGKGEAAGARATLDELARTNPDFRSPDSQLLYARALESEGNVQRALEQYAQLAGSYPGAEAAVRYAQLLSSQGMRAEAQRVARELLDQARIAPAHYRKAQRSWLDSAERLATQG